MAQEYSHRDFTGWSFKNRPEYDFNVKVIRGSCFSQEMPDSDIFPDGVSGREFYNCNLDNVKLPPDSIAVDCLQRRFMAQPDGFDWIVDENNQPIERL